MMDTSTHAIIGLGLAGLAQCDALVALDPATSTAVFFGVLIGSQAPDFDTVLKWKSNMLYIRQHRGYSHSLPMIAVWSFLISGVLTWLNKGASFTHVLVWTGLAVCLHVLTDVFNAYGTQAGWPFTKRWISWNIISLFDPIIFSTHLIAIVLWGFGILSPRVLFPALYLLLIAYYVWRTRVHRQVERHLPLLDTDYEKGETYTIIPTVALSRWNVVKRKPNGSFMIGHWKRGILYWTERAVCHDHPAVEASKSHPAVQALLYFSNYACATVEQTGYGYAVRWVDVRYRHRKQYPLVAIVMMNLKYETLDYFIGWLSHTRTVKRYGLE